MKLVHKSIEKDGCGSIGLIPEEPEDMWHAYNLISEGDAVTASTVRKVQTESSTGSSTSSRVRTTLTINVENIDFDTQACMLRLKGRNIVENQYVKMGAYHTLDLELNRKFVLKKPLWDSVALERVEMACDPAANADVAAVVMQEGLAHVCLITPSMTLVRSKIDMTIPRKRKGFVQQHEKGLAKFYEAVMQGILRHVDFSIVKCVIIASPGFVKDQFFDYMVQQAIKTDNKLLLDNKGKFLLVKASSGFKHSLKDYKNITAKLTEDTSIWSEYESSVPAVQYAESLSWLPQVVKSLIARFFSNSPDLHPGVSVKHPHLWAPWRGDEVEPTRTVKLTRFKKFPPEIKKQSKGKAHDCSVVQSNVLAMKTNSMPTDRSSEQAGGTSKGKIVGRKSKGNPKGTFQLGDYPRTHASTDVMGLDVEKSKTSLTPLKITEGQNLETDSRQPEDTARDPKITTVVQDLVGWTLVSGNSSKKQQPVEIFPEQTKPGNRLNSKRRKAKARAKAAAETVINTTPLQQVPGSSGLAAGGQPFPKVRPPVTRAAAITTAGGTRSNNQLPGSRTKSRPTATERTRLDETTSSQGEHKEQRTKTPASRPHIANSSTADLAVAITTTSGHLTIQESEYVQKVLIRRLIDGATTIGGGPQFDKQPVYTSRGLKLWCCNQRSLLWLQEGISEIVLPSGEKLMVLQEPAVIAKISDTKAASEVKLLESFYTMLQLEPAKAFYGKRHVERANEALAIETLMISDKLFRCQDVQKRKEYVALVDSVRENGGDVRIFSSMHVSGEQLDQLTGVAAILRFPMPELEDSEEDDSGSDSD